MKINYNVYSEINLDNLISNLNFIKNLNRGKDIIGVVKDDAYGHGAVEISKKLVENGVKILAVSDLDEGISLRKSGINASILIFGITPIERVEELINNDLTQTLSSFEYYDLINKELINLNKRLKVQIKIDTGMGRVGLFASDENLKIVNNIFINPLFDVQGVYSHLSDADCECDEYTRRQYKLFSTFCNNLERMQLNIKYKHISNSSGSLRYNFDFVNFIRPGILLYGYSAFKEYIQLKPVMELKAKIVHIKKIHKGESIGYNRTYVTKRDSIIATLNVGYGHGYPRYLSNKGRVILKGKFANIVGRVCMDHCMIDITDIGEVKLFDEVILMGKYEDKEIYAHEIADLGNTICYEMLCGVRSKISRVYLEGNNIKCIRER